VITHRRHRETWQQQEDRYRHQQEDYRREEERRDRSGIGIRITGTVHSLSIAGNRTSSCPLLGTALSAMVMIGMTDLISSIRMMISGLMRRLEGER